jgi:hypothetical protein
MDRPAGGLIDGNSTCVSTSNGELSFNVRMMKSRQASACRPEGEFRYSTDSIRMTHNEPS